NLLDIPANQPQPVGMQVMPDNEGRLWLTTTQPFGGQPTRKLVGRVGAVEASYVALTTSKGLVVLDPLRGVPLWTKASVPSSTEIFGDDQHIYLVGASDTSITGPSQVLRASDGSPVEARDFTYLYKHRIRTMGRNLLTSAPDAGKVTLRLYDVRAGKELWKRSFEGKAVVLQTEDEHLTGAIEPNGKIIVVDLRNFKEVLNSSVIEARITADDIKDLQRPLLLDDNERFYVALNTPIDPQKVMGGVLSSNFANGIRCAPVNGWVCAFLKKTGEFDWHLESKTTNQMLVLEQFRNLPILLFSVRYTEPLQGGVGGARMVSYTGSVAKDTGSVIWWPPQARQSNGSAQFYAFNIDVKAGTINMIGYNGTVQHYIDDGRKVNGAGNRGPGAGPGAQPPILHDQPPRIIVPPGKRLPPGGRGRVGGGIMPAPQPQVLPLDRLPVRDAAVPKR
ncbi:MAG TPA: hypothetical protein VEL76_26245, partial [Gemmataceae bacterium]|nr:hypothetical protein [Gemmataceae bacterium]